MTVQTRIPIKATAKQVWSIITNIQQSQQVIDAIERIEVLEQPAHGVVGLKWKETRKLFGKEATEIMWITEAEESVYYTTQAESHGAIYQTELRIKENTDGVVLVMNFTGTPVSSTAKVMWLLTGWMMKSSMQKTLQQDLVNIKDAAESQ